MPETMLPLQWRRAALQLEARLREVTGQVPTRLDIRTTARYYPRRPYVAGWRVGITFPDRKLRRIDVVATAGFPSVPVRTALVDHPPFMTWPHVESDGILCLLPNMAECDPDDPCAVAENLLNRSIRLVEELLEGTIIERDFREEFLTYWAYKAHADGSHFVSLLTPEPPSRVVRVWRGENLEIVGEDAETLAQWVRRRFGAEVDVTTEEGAFLWLRTPPLPADYPNRASDLRALAVAAGNDAVAALGQAAVGEPDHLVAVLGAAGRGGAGLIAVRVPNPKLASAHPRSAAQPLSRGFRPGRTPRTVLVNRYFGAGSVVRSSVQRADSNWVHGRACGAHYHPYGPVELNHVTAMIGDVALECLLSPPTHSFSRVFATSQRRIDDLGARWSDEWSAGHGNDDPGIRTVDRPWLRTMCPACRDQPVDEVA